MRILALNAYHGGSHRAFLDGWQRHSRHEFIVMSLPAYKWKWRMRHAAVTFAEQIDAWPAEKSHADALFCTDMLNLAEFLGLVRATLRRIPAVVYFHENQLTYPSQGDNQGEDARDLHYAFTNLTTGLAANRVWFNSNYHRDSFLEAVQQWMLRMPDFALTNASETIRCRSEIHPPGIQVNVVRPPREPGPIRIVWAARWEHDKDPATFFAALEILAQSGFDFRLRVLGESFGRVPDCFETARKRFAKHIDHWGFIDEPKDYLEMLARSDLIVSTARHEFFGIAVLEAIAAGCVPLAPRALAYPEILRDDQRLFHDGSPEDLAQCIQNAANNIAGARIAPVTQRPIDYYDWNEAARRLDDAIEQVATSVN